ncbi:MAG: LPS export ABC transporter ATP-binding protein [bacterium]
MPRKANRLNSLSAAELHKSYKHKKVVNNVHLKINPGEIVGLLGPNGAGKTTSFYMIVGLIQPDSGCISLNDEDITQSPMYMRARKGIGYLSQEPSIFRHLSVEDNLKAILEMLPITLNEKEEKLEHYLTELGLQLVRMQRADTLSGGEKRRCEIARALVTDPKFLLLDEPFVGIDPIAVNDIQNIVSLLREKGLGILITDHNVRETLEIIDRAYIMFEGNLLLEGNSEELLRSKEARKVYLGDKFKM